MPLIIGLPTIPRRETISPLSFTFAFTFATTSGVLDPTLEYTSSLETTCAIMTKHWISKQLDNFAQKHLIFNAYLFILHQHIKCTKSRWTISEDYLCKVKINKIVSRRNVLNSIWAIPISCSLIEAGIFGVCDVFCSAKDVPSIKITIFRDINSKRCISDQRTTSIYT